MDVEATLTAHLVGRIPGLRIIATGGGELAVFRKSES